jgi:hypothetical protein
MNQAHGTNRKGQKRRMIMRKLILSVVASLALLIADGISVASVAHAGGIAVGVNIGLPFPAPVIYAPPAPVYYAAPAYYPPPPVYYAPRVVYAPPVYYPPRVVYTQPYYGGHYYRGHHGHGGYRGHGGHGGHWR